MAFPPYFEHTAAYKIIQILSRSRCLEIFFKCSTILLQVNDMDMNGVTREEAVLFLLSLQDQIDLIAQYRKDEYDQIVQLQRGDSFYIRAHFNYDHNDKGEMTFKKSDVFHVVDTLHNGVVGSWQAFRMDPFLSGLGRAAEQVQKGVIPNKSRAEEIATQQFNAAKKEQSVSENNKSSFFKRRKAQNHRRSKSLGKVSFLRLYNTSIDNCGMKVLHSQLSGSSFRSEGIPTCRNTASSRWQSNEICDY